MKVPVLPSELIMRIGWCQGSSAKDARGHGVSINSPTVVGYCMLGAIAVCSFSESDGRWMREKLEASLGGVIAISVWNDAKHRTKTEVITALRAVNL